MRDFVVVGAGPAGSRFARQAASAGYDVLVLERGSIGAPLACSGHLSRRIWDFVPEDSRSELHQNDIHGARFHLGDPGSPAYRFDAGEPISNALDRVGLDQALAAEARAAGASVRTGHTVTDVTEHADHVAVTVSHDGGTDTVEARMVAGCDGPLSRVRTALSLPEPSELLHGVLAFDSTPDADDFVDVHLTVPRFFAWRIPRGAAGVEYGLATTSDNDVHDRFRAFTRAYDVSTGDTCAGGIPIGPPSSVTSKRGFLIGDAAGQTKPFTGGGIIYGMTAADIAAETIDPADPDSLAAYETAWRSELSRDIRLGRWIRRAYSLPQPVQRFGLWLTSGTIGVDMDRPTSVFSREHLRAMLSR